MACGGQSELEEEVEAVHSILMEGVFVTRGADCIESVRVDLHPLTASQSERQYVRLGLIIRPDADYPHSLPQLQIVEPRGLAESDVCLLQRLLGEKCAKHLGEPMLFELVDAAREFITERNLPACDCAICLMAIVEEDDFVRTNCYHYFHSTCLAEYIKQLEDSENIVCPICREKLRREDLRLDGHAKPPLMQFSERFEPCQQLRERRSLMKELFARQKAKGSIIDLEQEEKRFLLTTTNNSNSSSTPTASSSVVSSSLDVSVERGREALESLNLSRGSSTKRGQSRRSRGQKVSAHSNNEGQRHTENRRQHRRGRGSRGRSNEPMLREKEGFRGNNWQDKSGGGSGRHGEDRLVEANQRSRQNSGDPVFDGCSRYFGTQNSS